MTQEENPKKTAAESFGEIFKAFGDAISEIFDDPELKEKAKDFVDSAAGSAKTIGNRFKDEEVRDKFRGVGKAAQDFGEAVADCFTTKKNE